MGEKWLKIKQSPKKFLDQFLSHFSPMSVFQTGFFSVIKKQSPRSSWTPFYLEPFLPHVWDYTTKNYKFSLYPFLTYFSTRVLKTQLWGQKEACIGPALSPSAKVLGMEQPTVHNILLIFPHKQEARLH